MKNKVVVVGSYNTDMTIKTKKLPSPGETVIGGYFSTGGGGKGANQAIAAARIGAEVNFVARVGNDFFGREGLKQLKEEHINTEYVFSDDNLSTGVAFIVVDDIGENSIVVASGANTNLSPADIETAKPVISSADILLIQLESPIESVYASIKSAHDNGVTVILNPAPAQELDKHILKYIDIITPNVIEAEMLTGINVTDAGSLHSIVNRFFEYGIHNVIITLGSKGYYAGFSDVMKIIPALKVAPVDTTGAGDVFSGSLAAFLSEGMALERAARMANVAASVSVSRIGAQDGAPKRVEIEKFISSYETDESKVLK
jgi:ribokinase